MRSVILKPYSQISSVIQEVSEYWFSQIYSSLLYIASPTTYYVYLQKHATTLEQYLSAGNELDKIQGNELWKLEEKSNDYEYGLLKDRLRLLKKARENGDPRNMIFLLRTSLSRHIGDMGNPKLYEHCHVGTKKLIQDYIEEVCKQLDYICHHPSLDISLQSKIDFFNNLQKAFGRTALLLSGGATFGLSHLGIIKTLYEANLLPKIISGSSGGSIIAAAVCCHGDDEFHNLFHPENLDLDVFEVKEEQGYFWHKLNRLIQHGVFFDVEVLIKAMRENLGGDITFLEAYNKTRRILNITVSSSTNYEMPRLLNYLTAPNVVIWSAVAASCSVPLFYRSATLRAKRDGVLEDWNPTESMRWIDGSVEGDLPMQRISELFNVNHFIVSQVNPHVVPFVDSGPPKRFFSKVISQLAGIIRLELQHRLNQLLELGISSSMLYRIYAILGQKYYGDITIIPQIESFRYFQLFSNPDPKFVTDFTILGEKATWPKLSIIKNHCQLELMIDELVNQLKSKKFDRIPRTIKSLRLEYESGVDSSNDSDSGHSTKKILPHLVVSVSPE